MPDLILNLLGGLPESSRPTINRSLARSLEPSLDRALDGSITRSLALSLARALARLLDHSIFRSITRSFNRSVQTSLYIDLSVTRPLGLDRSIASFRPPSFREGWGRRGGGRRADRVRVGGGDKKPPHNDRLKPIIVCMKGEVSVFANQEFGISKQDKNKNYTIRSVVPFGIPIV